MAWQSLFIVRLDALKLNDASERLLRYRDPLPSDDGPQEMLDRTIEVLSIMLLLSPHKCRRDDKILLHAGHARETVLSLRLRKISRAHL